MSTLHGPQYERGRSRTQRNRNSKAQKVTCSFPEIDILDALVYCGTRIDDYLDEHKFYRRRRSRRYSYSFDSYDDTSKVRMRSKSRTKVTDRNRHEMAVGGFHSKKYEERYEDDFEDPLPIHSLHDGVNSLVRRHDNFTERDDPNISFYGGSVMTTRVANNSIQEDNRFSGSNESRRLPAQRSYVNRSGRSHTSLPRIRSGQLHGELGYTDSSFRNQHNRSSSNLSDTKTSYFIKGYQEVSIPPGKAGLTLLNTSEGLVIQHIKSTSVANDLQVGDVIIALDGIDIARYPSDVVLQLLERKKELHRSIGFKRYNMNNDNDSFRTPLQRDSSSYNKHRRDL